MMQLEEGEIAETEDVVENEIDPYTPLQRPMYSKVETLEDSFDEDDGPQMKLLYSSDDEDDNLPKRPRLKPLPVKPPVKKKYTIWCKDANSHLTDILGNVNVTANRFDRSVESYTVPNNFNNKTRRRKRPKGRRRSSSITDNDDKNDLDSLKIDDLETDESNTNEEIALDIARKLSEPNTRLILKIVMIVGKSKAIEYFKDTQNIEQNGGMLILNKSRRRTSGGIFMFLVRGDHTNSKEDIEKMFTENGFKPRRGKLRKRKKSKEDDNLNDDKGHESGQEVMSNPPPSPVSSEPPLPELPLRRDLVLYEDLSMDLV